MILNHQPTIFGSRLSVALSSVADGDLTSVSRKDSTKSNLEIFLSKNGFDYEQTQDVHVQFNNQTDYCRYIDVSRQPSGNLKIKPANRIIADALITRRLDQPLFLGLADCCGVVLFDSARSILMLSHLGRHSLEQQGAHQSVQYLIANYQSQPADLLIWLSPAVGANSYPIHRLAGMGIQAAVVKQLLESGIKLKQIEVCSVDTALDVDYFSHSQFLAGRRPVDGRHGVAVKIIK